MPFKMVATVTVLIMAAGASCGCSTVPSWAQAQDGYGASQAALGAVCRDCPYG
jgi:uncharacterized protein YceK